MLLNSKTTRSFAETQFYFGKPFPNSRSKYLPPGRSYTLYTLDEMLPVSRYCDFGLKCHLAPYQNQTYQSDFINLSWLSVYPRGDLLQYILCTHKYLKRVEVARIRIMFINERSVDKGNGWTHLECNLRMQLKI